MSMAGTRDKEAAPRGRDARRRRDAPTESGGSGAADRESDLRHDDHRSLRLWLRLLTCSLMIERVIRSRLRATFATTLPRFDLLAQLERHPEGLRMGELSRGMMVTGGNVTGITEQLVGEGLVERVVQPEDRRAHVVRLTRRGKRAFAAMAREHERWIDELVGTLALSDRRQLYRLLARLKAAVSELPEALAPPDAATPKGASGRQAGRRRAPR